MVVVLVYVVCELSMLVVVVVVVVVVEALYLCWCWLLLLKFFFARVGVPLIGGGRLAVGWGISVKRLGSRMNHSHGAWHGPRKKKKL